MIEFIVDKDCQRMSNPPYSGKVPRPGSHRDARAFLAASMQGLSSARLRPSYTHLNMTVRAFRLRNSISKYNALREGRNPRDRSLVNLTMF